jgi:anti-anti-sigma factor
VDTYADCILNFHVTADISPPTATLRLAGEFDVFAAREVTGCVEEALAAGCHDVRVDAAGVTFVDAGSLGTLLKYQLSLQAAEGNLEVTAASPAFIRICVLARLDRLLAPDLRDRPV